MSLNSGAAYLKYFVLNCINKIKRTYNIYTENITIFKTNKITINKVSKIYIVMKISKKITTLIILSIISVGGLYTPIFALGDTFQDDLINQEVKEINQQIQNQRQRLKKIQDKQKVYSDIIKKKQAEKSTLNNQLAILDNRLAKTELDIEMVRTEIKKVDLEIQKTNTEIENKKEEIKKEKKHIKDILQLIYKQDTTSNLEIILLNNSFSDFLSQAKYLEDINKKVKEKIENLRRLRKKMEKEKTRLAEEQDKLSDWKKELAQKKEKLESEKEDKTFILDQVKSSEKEYQRLLAQAKKEQQEAASEIASMEKLVRAKLSKLQGKKLEFNDNGFVWPVPKNVITTYFHDPDYPFRYIFEHPGVDIRAAQGTPIRAAASGYVARAKDAGYGYSYIMIIHGDGLSTVYGHVSKIFVKEDEYVVQGQTIGLSGGLPGTRGAGRLTTGPHLHFEVRKNGIPVDPLEYLP